MSNARPPTFLRRFIVDSVPPTVRTEVGALPPALQQEFSEAYERRGRSTGAAYCLCLLIGAHYAYVRRWGLQVLFWVTLFGLGIWLVVDLFRIPTMVRRYNEGVAREILLALTAR